MIFLLLMGTLSTDFGTEADLSTCPPPRVREHRITCSVAASGGHRLFTVQMPDTTPGSSSSPAKSKAQAKLRNPRVASPKSKAKATAEPLSTPHQVEITYNQFVSLGMPTDVISLTEFARLYCPPQNSTIGSMVAESNLKSTKSKGKAKDTTIHTTTSSTLTQALDFICTHLVGRQEVRKRRAQIAQCVPRSISQFSQKLRGML